jgi:hypothetical protein
MCTYCSFYKNHLKRFCSGIFQLQRQDPPSTEGLREAQGGGRKRLNKGNLGNGGKRKDITGNRRNKIGHEEEAEVKTKNKL